MLRVVCGSVDMLLMHMRVRSWPAASTVPCPCGMTVVKNFPAIKLDKSRYIVLPIHVLSEIDNKPTINIC